MDESRFISTFLFTDIEGSTRLWEVEPARMQRALAAHDHVARFVVETRGGRSGIALLRSNQSICNDQLADRFP